MSNSVAEEVVINFCSTF